MTDVIDREFLITPTALEDGTGKVHEVMPQTIGAMNSILARFPTLSWEVFNKIYSQWYELDQLEIEGEIVMFDEFCEATKAILARPLDATNPQEFIRTVTFIERFDNSEQSSEVMQQFQRYLPRIPQETIDAVKGVWKKQVISRSSDINSDHPHIFFNREADSGGRYPDLTYLDYFYKKTTDDAEITKWYQKLSPWIPKWCGVV